MASVGIDFGTSNSAAAIPGADDGPARVLAIDEAAEDARLLRSVLFFPDGTPAILAGAAAIEAYLRDFEGRSARQLKKVHDICKFSVVRLPSEGSRVSVEAHAHPGKRVSQQRRSSAYAPTLRTRSASRSATSAGGLGVRTPCNRAAHSVRHSRFSS